MNMESSDMELPSNESEERQPSELFTLRQKKDNGEELTDEESNRLGELESQLRDRLNYFKDQDNSPKNPS